MNTPGYVLRLSTREDNPAMLRLIRARADWLDDHGLNGGPWRRDAVKLVERSNHGWRVWLLLHANGRLAARISTSTKCPRWLFPVHLDRRVTGSDLALDAGLFIHGTVTHPDFADASRLATTAIVQAACMGSLTWVRRGTPNPELARYYEQLGFERVNVVERHGRTVFGLQRRAEPNRTELHNVEIILGTPRRDEDTHPMSA